MDDANQAESSMISTSLELEQIEVNLFRSKSLYQPKAARGVFGGQVISQAMVAATNCVNPEFGLHVRARLFLPDLYIDIKCCHPLVFACELCVQLVEQPYHSIAIQNSATSF